VRRPNRSFAAALVGVLLLGTIVVAAVAGRDERLGRSFDKLARSLGFTGEDELAGRFRKSTLARTSSLRPTALQFGRDDRLYVAQQDGVIKAYEIARGGPGAYRVTTTETISLVHDIPNHDDDGRLNPRVRGRQLTGMVVTGTAKSPEIYVSSSDPRVGGGGEGTDTRLDTNSGVISRLRRVNGAWRVQHILRGLPRSEELHATNGLALAKDGKTLYVAQGSNTNAGAPSRNFALLPQYALSGAVLAIDLAAIGDATYDLPTLDDETRPGPVDDGDPFGGNDGRNQARLVGDSPLTLHATGFRNPYDLVVTSAGRLVTIDNGMNENWGGLPAGEGTDRCTNAARESGKDARDALHVVTAPGYYAGNPNPTRGNRANVFNEDGQSPVAAQNRVECDWREPGSENGALATFGSSTNGLTEYRSASLDGDLRGDLLAVSFDGSVHRVRLGRDADDTSSGLLFAAATTVPLDVTAQDDDAVFPGTIWVAGYATGEIVVFEPDDYGLGRWEPRAATGQPRQEVAFVAAEGRLYLAGGGTAHQAYDPKQDTWTSVAPLPEKLDHIQGVELDGRIYYIGGLRSWPEPAVDTVLVYEPRTDRFTKGTPMPRPRGAGGVASHAGKVYYLGGLSQGRAVPWVDEYDPQTGRWAQLADMPHARDHFQAVVIGNTLYAVGGRELEIDATIDAVDAFDLQRGTWQQGLAPLPTPRGGFATAVAGAEILVIGGEGGGKTFDTTEAYDTRANSWRKLAPMRVARHGISAAVCGGVFIAAGGREQGGGEPTDAHEVFFPSADTLPCG